MAPGRPATGTSIRNGKAERTVFNRGVAAAKAGKSLADCPYLGTSESAEHVSFARKWRAAWMKGFKSVKKTPEMPPP